MSTDPLYLKAAMNAAATRTYRIALRFGISDAEREDIKQDILLDLLQHEQQYDPSRASLNTFTGLVSEHRAVELVDALVKERCRRGTIEARAAANDPVFDAGLDGVAEFADNVVPMWTASVDLLAEADLRYDIEAAQACMSGEQLDLCGLLVSHQDLPSAAKASGIPSATFYRRVADLRMHMRMFGVRSAA